VKEKEFTMAPPAGFDIKAAHIAKQIKCERPLNCCRIDPKVENVIAGGESGTPQRVNIATGKVTNLENGHESWIFDAAWLPDGTRCVTSGGDGRLIWWDLTSEKPAKIHTIEAHKGWIRSLAISPDGKTLLSGANDGKLKLWNLSDAKPLLTVEASKRDIYRAIFSPDGKELISGDLMGGLMAWNTADGKEAAKFEGKPLHNYNGGQQVDFGGIRALAMTPDGKTLVAGGLHKASNPLGAVHEPLAIVFGTADKKQIRQWTANGITGGIFWSIRHLSDGSFVGASGGSSGGFLLFYKTDGEKEIHRLPLGNIVRDMDLGSDGLTIVTAHHDRQIRITKLSAKKA
jgi:WD40 repeat protein